MLFSFAGTAQEAGAGGRSGAAGIPVHGSLICLILSPDDTKHTSPGPQFKRRDPCFVVLLQIHIMLCSTKTT